jgi:hypothetical protein
MTDRDRISFVYEDLAEAEWLIANGSPERAVVLLGIARRRLRAWLNTQAASAAREAGRGEGE